MYETIKLHPKLICIIIYQSWFPARWLTQYYLASDVESNSSPSQVCTMLAHVNIGAGVHVHNTPPTYINNNTKWQHATTNQTKHTKTYTYYKSTSTAWAIKTQKAWTTSTHYITDVIIERREKNIQNPDHTKLYIHWNVMRKNTYLH